MNQSVMIKSQGLQRGMKERHVTMLAIGGTIGTGLFLGSGYVLSEAGPLGSILAYTVGGLLMYIMMMCLGELVVAMPVAGSTQAYANEYVSQAAGFMSGWIRWLACAVTITSQLVASSIIMKNILPSVNSVVWIVLFTVVLLILNLFPAGTYGETEFWFVSIKVITIVVFIIMAFGIALGLIGNISSVRAVSSTNSLFPGGFKNILMTIMTASFAYGGVDLIASAAGESHQPQKSLPRAINKSVFSLIAIYIVTLGVLSFILPWQDANLKGSPFAYVFKAAGLSSAELLINVVVVTSALSSANTFIYSCTRTLWSLGKHKQAAEFLGIVNRKKVPVNALLVSIAFACIALVTSFISADTVYLYLISSVGVSNMFLYSVTCLCQYNFRKKYLKDGQDINKLKFKAPLYPILPILGIILYTILVAIMVLEPTQRIALYSSLPIFAVIYLSYKRRKTSEERCSREKFQKA
jgi:arginine/ornithine permease